MKQINQVDVLVGTRIRERRHALRMTQTVLANGLGITFQQLQKYERGINRVPAGRLQLLAIILDVPVSFFFELATANPAADEIRRLRRALESKDVASLNRAYLRISNPAIRRAVFMLIDAIVGAERRVLETGLDETTDRNPGPESNR